MAEQAPTPAPRPRPAPARAAPTGWASALSGAADRLPSYVCLLAQVAVTTRAIGGRAARIVDAGRPAEAWREALGSAAKIVGDHAGVELEIRSAVGDRTRPGDPPLGCVAVDLGHAPAVRTARELLALPPAALLPQVLVPVRLLSSGGGPFAPGPRLVDPFDDLPGDRTFRPDAMAPWSADRGDGALERLFVLDLPQHPAHPVIDAEDEVSARRRRRALTAR